MSDHLPQSVTLQVYPGSYHILCKTSYIDWKKLDDRMIEQYVMGVNLCVSSGLHKQVKKLIKRSHVYLVLWLNYLHALRSERKKPYIRDDFLRSLCYKNLRARQLWIKQGHPRCGPIYEV